MCREFYFSAAFVQLLPRNMSQQDLLHTVYVEMYCNEKSDLNNHISSGCVNKAKNPQPCWHCEAVLRPDAEYI